MLHIIPVILALWTQSAASHAGLNRAPTSYIWLTSCSASHFVFCQANQSISGGDGQPSSAQCSSERSAEKLRQFPLALSADDSPASQSSPAPNAESHRDSQIMPAQIGKSGWDVNGTTHMLRDSMENTSMAAARPAVSEAEQPVPAVNSSASVEAAEQPRRTVPIPHASPEDRAAAPAASAGGMSGLTQSADTAAHGRGASHMARASSENLLPPLSLPSPSGVAPSPRQLSMLMSSSPLSDLSNFRPSPPSLMSPSAAMLKQGAQSPLSASTPNGQLQKSFHSWVALSPCLTPPTAMQRRPPRFETHGEAEQHLQVRMIPSSDSQ